MSRASLLSTLVLGLVLLSGCAQAAPAQPSAPPTAAAPVATTAPKPTAGAATASKPATPTTAPKPSAAAAKPTASPAPAGAAASSAAKPAAQASPKPNGGSSAQGSPPAVVATSAAALPAVVAPTAPAKTSPAPAAAAPKPNGGASAKPADALGVAASAGSAAAVTTGPDVEATALCGQGAILSTRASQAAGRQATIAIAKVEASYQPNVRGQPTFLNDAPYPNHGFTAVIWGGERRSFDPAPTSWQGKALCVTGAVEMFQQKPQITVNAPSQLRAAR